MIAGWPSSRCSTRWNRYIIAGVRTAGMIEDPGHVEADALGLEVGPILGIVEQPGVFAAFAPGGQPGGQVAGVRPAHAAEELAQVTQAAVPVGCAKLASTASASIRAVFRVERRAPAPRAGVQPLDQEGAVDRPCRAAAAG